MKRKTQNKTKMAWLITVDTRNSGPGYSGFTCFSGQNCADQL